MSTDEFQKDANGHVILKPVISCTTAPVAEIAVLLAIQYADNPQELQTGGKQIQFVLIPPQCLEVSEMLTRAANRILQAPAKKPRQ